MDDQIMVNRILAYVYGLGPRLKNSREKLRMSIDTLSENTKLSRSTISRIETGNVNPDLASVIKMGEILMSEIEAVDFAKRTDIIINCFSSLSLEDKKELNNIFELIIDLEEGQNTK